ncbi:MAG: hypothetical protein R3B70_10400 [Polyangiaceae bacterium]
MPRRTALRPHPCARAEQCRATTERSYFTARNRLRSIATETPAGLVQRLHYTWDARQDLAGRTDDLQQAPHRALPLTLRALTAICLP